MAWPRAGPLFLGSGDGAEVKLPVGSHEGALRME